MIPDSQTFRSALNKILYEANEAGKDSVEVTSGDLHRKVGGYPGKNHRMPICCEVMRSAMRERDVIRHQPPKGNGATLTIRYKLPR